MADALREASFLQELKSWKKRQAKSESGDSTGTFENDSEDSDCQDTKLLQADAVSQLSLDESSSGGVDVWRQLSAAVIGDEPSGDSECCSQSQSSDSESVSSGGSTGSYRRPRRRRNRPRRDVSGSPMTFWNSDYCRRRQDRSTRYGNGRPESQQSRRWEGSNEELSEGCRSRDSRSSFWSRH